MCMTMLGRRETTFFPSEARRRRNIRVALHCRRCSGAQRIFRAINLYLLHYQQKQLFHLKIRIYLIHAVQARLWITTGFVHHFQAMLQLVVLFNSFSTNVRTSAVKDETLQLASDYLSATVRAYHGRRSAKQAISRNIGLQAATPRLRFPVVQGPACRHCPYTRHGRTASSVRADRPASPG